MALQLDFLSKLEYLETRTIHEILSSTDRPTSSVYWMIENQISPADMFCYLHARFGPPNGIQNLLRQDSSDNLVHWNWTFRYSSGLLDIQGTNFYTQILFVGDCDVEESELKKFITLVKADFQKQSKGMAKIRESLESWVEFINPYQRLRRAIDQLVEELALLKPYEITEPAPPLSSSDRSNQEAITEQWHNVANRLNKAFGICFGIRSMLPVLGEAFINLILYILMRPELKADKRLRENVFKQNIDVRVRSLSLNCYGFKQAVDFSEPICRRFHSIMNERNDLLHGNIAINKLRFNETYFWGNVPIFKEYCSMWNRAFEVQRNSVGLDKVSKEIAIVMEFIEYVLSCLEERMRTNVEYVISRLELGLNEKEDRVGVLFSEDLVDFRLKPDSTSSEKKG